MDSEVFVILVVGEMSAWSPWYVPRFEHPSVTLPQVKYHDVWK